MLNTVQDVISTQIQIINEKLQMISDPYQEAHIRTLFLQCLINLDGDISLDNNSAPSKDDIKEDTIKDSVKSKEEIKAEEELINTINSTLEEPKEISLDDNKEEEEEEEEEEETTNNDRILIDIDGETIDITDAYNYLDKVEAGDIKDEAAAIITIYGLQPILDTIKTDNTIAKVQLARYIQEYGIDQIDGVVNELTDGMFSSTIEFVTNENIEALIAELDALSSDE